MGQSLCYGTVKIDALTLIGILGSVVFLKNLIIVKIMRVKLIYFVYISHYLFMQKLRIFLFLLYFFLLFQEAESKFGNSISAYSDIHI